MAVNLLPRQICTQVAWTEKGKKTKEPLSSELTSDRSLENALSADYSSSPL